MYIYILNFNKKNKYYICDSSTTNKKIKELTDWKPVYSFEEGLSETISFFKDNMDKYKPDIYNI